MQISNFYPNFTSSDVHIMYFSDSHGNTGNLDAFKTAFDEFKLNHQSQPNFVLSSGDILIDKSKKNSIIIKAMNNILDAVAIGNHDIEGESKFLKHLKSSKFTWLANNISITDKVWLKKYIKKSVILSRNGENIGVIGLMPFDYDDVVQRYDLNISIKNFEETLKALRYEIYRLEKQGVNKIVLLAHTGEKSANGINYYKEFAKLGGIDVIIGGHDHKEVEKYIFSNRNEPVLIVACGESSEHGFLGNLDLFGELNITFDDNGVIVPDKTKNKFFQTKTFPQADYISQFKDKNDNDVLYTLSSPVTCDRPLVSENKIADIVADSNLWYVNAHTKGEKADFAFVNAGTVRGDFKSKSVTDEDVQEIVPFITSTLIKTTLTKKQIFDTLEWCAKSTKFAKVSPGIMQVAGLKYTINPDFSVQDVYITDFDGNIVKKLDELDDNEIFTCVYDRFLATGVSGLSGLKKDFTSDRDMGDTEFFDVSRQYALREYLKFHQKSQIANYDSQRITFNTQVCNQNKLSC